MASHFVILNLACSIFAVVGNVLEKSCFLQKMFLNYLEFHFQICARTLVAALRYSNSEGQWKEMAVRLTNSLTNIRAIINHFSPKVDSWAASNHLSSLTEEQVHCYISMASGSNHLTPN